jgi:hypothetical protein
MIGLPRILTGSRAQLGQKQFDLKKQKKIKIPICLKKVRFKPWISFTNFTKLLI